MGIDMWFKDDIRNILLGVELAARSQLLAAEGETTRAYREGFDAAITAIAASFGLFSSGSLNREERTIGI